MAVALVWSQRRARPFQVSGFLESDEIRVGSRVGGRVARVAVVEGQRVKSGDVLVEQELDNANAAIRAAAATLEARREELDQLKAGTRAEEIAEAQAKAREAEEAAKMFASGYRGEEVKQAQAAVAAAAANLAALDQQ